jgi:hypothetical protein
MSNIIEVAIFIIFAYVIISNNSYNTQEELLLRSQENYKHKLK